MDFKSFDADADEYGELDAIGQIVKHATEAGCSCEKCASIREMIPYLASIRVLRDEIIANITPENGVEAIHQGLLFVNALLMEAAGMIEPIMQIKNLGEIKEYHPSLVLDMMASAKMSMVVQCDPAAKAMVGSETLVSMKTSIGPDGDLLFEKISGDSTVDLKDVGNGMAPTNIFKQFFNDGSQNLN